jgi:hypothetical protein
MSPSCLAGVLALSAAAPLPPRPMFQWKFEPGRTFYIETATETQQEMTVLGNKVPQTQAQVFTFSLTPERQLADGTWLIKQRIIGVRMSLDLGGQRIEFDSTKPGQGDNPLSDFLRGAVGAEFRLHLGRAKGVVAVEGREELLRRLGEARPEIKPLLQTILTEQALKEMNGQTFAALPERGVYKGDVWQRRSRRDLGPFGAYEMTHRYTLLGTKGTYEVFTVEVTDVHYEAPTQGDSTLPFKILKADLKGSGREGEMRFDRERGRVVRVETRLTLEGDLSVEIGGQETKMGLKQEQKTTVRTLDTNPLEEPRPK